MSVSIGKGVTIYKSVTAGKSVGARALSSPAEIAIAGRIAALTKTLGALTLSADSFVTAQATQQLFRTQYIIASAISSVSTEMPIPTPITTNSRALVFSPQSKYSISGPQDHAGFFWTGTRDGGFQAELVSNSSVMFARSSSLTAGTLSTALGGIGLIEYIGATGGAHDIQSLGRFVATLTTAIETLSTTLPVTPSNPDDVVPFITEIFCQTAGLVPRTAYAYMSGLSELNVVCRSCTSTTNSRHVYVNPVEFVGNAWNVLHCYLATSNSLANVVNVMTSPLGAGVTAAIDWEHTMIIPQCSTQGSAMAITASQRPHTIYPIIIPNDSSTASVLFNTKKETSFSTALETVGYFITNAEMSVLRVDNTALAVGWKEIDMSANSPGSASACWTIMQALTSASAFPHGCFTTFQASDTTVKFYNSVAPLANSRHHLQVAKLPRG